MPTGSPTAWPTWATRVASLHGGMPQGRRNRVLQGLRSRQLQDPGRDRRRRARHRRAARISHVINYGLPMKPEDYVHRIGRTGRAGRNGLAVTLAERMDAGMIRRIQQFTTQSIPVDDDRRPRAEGAGSRRCSRSAPGARGRSRPAARRARPRASGRRRQRRRRVRRRAASRGNPFDRALPVARRAPPARARPGPAGFKGRAASRRRPRPGGFAALSVAGERAVASAAFQAAPAASAARAR